MRTKLVIALAASLLGIGVLAAPAMAYLSYDQATAAAIGADGSDNDLGNFCAAHGCVGYPWWQCCPQQLSSDHWRLYFSWYSGSRNWTCRVDSYRQSPWSPIIVDTVEFCT